MMAFRRIALAMLVSSFWVAVSADDIAVLQAVGEEAKGAAKAREAATRLKEGGRANLVPLLAAFKGSSPLATNWLRSTFESIADAEQKAGRDLPKDRLLVFVRDVQQAPAARRLAYEWLLQRSPQLEDELIPSMLLDPSPAFRRDAVKKLVAAAKAAGDDGVELWKKALQGAVHEDQVSTICLLYTSPSPRDS